MLALVGIVLVVAMLMTKSDHKCACPVFKWDKSLKNVTGYNIANVPDLQVKCKGPDGKVDTEKLNMAVTCMVDTISTKYTPDEFFSDDPKSPVNDDQLSAQIMGVCASKAQCAGN